MTESFERRRGGDPRPVPGVPPRGVPGGRFAAGWSSTPDDADDWGAGPWDGGTPAPVAARPPRRGDAGLGDPAYGEPAYGDPAYGDPAYPDGGRPDGAGPLYVGAHPSAPAGASRLGPRHGAGPRLQKRREPRTKGQAAVGAGLEVVVVLSMALLLSLLIKTFLVQAFFIPSESMETTLDIGDRVLVNKLAPGPLDLHRGDVVVFRDPGGWLDPPPPSEESALRTAFRSGLTFVGLLPQDSGEHLIKRVIGLPGDRVVCCDDQDRITVNGVPLDETYVRAGVSSADVPFDVTVPADRLWVMGDNRGVSQDSRFHQDLPGKGFVPLEEVVGQAFVVVWPFERAGRLTVPDSVFAAVPDRSAPR